MAEERFRIVFAVYPGMTQLDFTGPHQILSALPGSEVIVASAEGGEVGSDGLVFARTRRLDDVEDCDLICVPGGGRATEVALDDRFVGQVRRLGQGARYVTSVCTGSLILGAAGLLVGRRATSHWAWRHLLPVFGAIADGARVVRDGNVITGGGVTAGMDFALTVLAELGGDRLAKVAQLGFEYAPRPPFDAGGPDTASPDVLAAYREQIAGDVARREREARQAADRLALPAAANDRARTRVDADVPAKAVP